MKRSRPQPFGSLSGDSLWRPVFALTFVALCTPLVAQQTGGQTGAERTKTPLSAVIKPGARQTASFPEVIGNVIVTYSDGSKDAWTTKGNASLVRVAEDGAVGWTVHEAERPAASASYTIRPNGKLIVCRLGEVVAKITSGLGFIEEWDFWDAGRAVRLRTRALHGPGRLELYEIATGRLVEAIPEDQWSTRPWATIFKE